MPFPASFAPCRLTLRALLALGLALFLSACASVSETISPGFADPAKYELWECKQLEGERKSLAERTKELERLMAKAETGAGGAVVAEMVYRNDYIAVRGQAHFAEEAWRRNKCQETPPAAASVAATPRPASTKQPPNSSKPPTAGH